MAEKRRVEPRAIVGTGMATDPERIRGLEDEQARRERAWRHAPERGFGEVLAEAPARGQLERDRENPSRRGTRPAAAPEAVEMTTEALKEGDAEPRQGTPAGAARAPSPRAPRDPREAALRRQLELAEAGTPLAERGQSAPARKPRTPA